jgi:hypothetical protein
MIFTASVRNILDIPSYRGTGVSIQLHASGDIAGSH